MVYISKTVLWITLVGSLASLKQEGTLYDTDNSTKVESQLWYAAGMYDC